MPAQKPTVDFDHHSAQFNVDPLGTLLGLARECPVAWTEAYGGYWIVTGGEEVAHVQKTPTVYSSARTEHGGVGVETVLPKSPSATSLPIESDPPLHTLYRRLLNAVLSPAASRDLRPAVRRWVDHYIDQFIEQGSCDLVYDFASPVPAAVTLEWLGWPESEWTRIAHLAHDLMGNAPGSERFGVAVTEARWLRGRLRELVAERRADPRDDIISYLVGQTLDGEPIDEDTASSMISTLIFGGVDTTTALTSQALLHLNHNADQRQALIDDPELIIPATEEFLRVYPPVVSSARTVVRDTELGGCPIKAGDRVLVTRWSANFDPHAFPNAHEFDLAREANRHQSFGLGPHRCAGAHLARIMFQEMLAQVLERLPDYRIDEDSAEPYPDQGAFIGWNLLPTTFTPGRRIGHGNPKAPSTAA